MHKESHQHIDIVSMFKPVTKWNACLYSAHIIPEVVRKAFKVSQAQKPGATHIELPADVMAEPVDAVRSPPARASATPSPPPQSCSTRSASSAPPSTRSCWPATGSPASTRRPRCASSRAPRGSAWRRPSWARGLLDFEDGHHLGTVGLQERDYALAGFEDADVVITIGYDLVAHAPKNWNPRKDRTIVCIDTVSVEVDEYFMTEVDLIGDLDHVLTRLTEELRDAPHQAGSSRLNDIVLGRFESAKDDDAFPVQPPRALWEIRQALSHRDLLISDVGLHKLWIARMFPAHEPDTVFIANGLAGMGIARPTAIAAKLVHLGRKVVTVNGGGGFLMNCQGLGGRRAPAHPDSSTSSGRIRSSARSCGSRTRSSAATSARTAQTRTSSSSPVPSGCPPGAARRPRTSGATCATR